MEEIQRKSALEDLYLKEEKTRQARAEAKRSEAEAAKSETQLRIYKLKANSLARDRNYGNPNDEDDLYN